MPLLNTKRSGTSLYVIGIEEEVEGPQNPRANRQTNKQTNNDRHCPKKDLVYKMTLVGGKGCLMQFGWWVASYYYCCSNKHCNDVTKAHLVLLQTC